MSTTGDQSATTDWELRARTLRTDPRGVLFKSFPPAFNRYLHDWHVAEACQVLAGFSRAAPLRVLDVGCGYGRLSQALQQVDARVRPIGIDVAPTFASLYQHETSGAAIVNDLRGLPLRAATCDLVLLVTTLMYVPAARRALLLSECLRVLKPEGRLLVIETSRHGQQIYSAFGLLTLLAKMFHYLDASVHTDGYAFSYPEIDELVQAAGGAIIRRSGAVRFTILLPFMLVLSRFGSDRFVERLLRACSPSVGAKKYSVHICYEVRRAT